MSTQTEPKLVTQIDFARAGQITPQMKEVAEREHRDPEYIRERVADGRIAIPANIVHIKKGMRAFGVGEGLSTKVNVNLGISGDKADAAEEWKKVKIAEDFGADAIMDLSNSGKTRQFRQQLIDETPLMVGTVPMYDAIGYMEKPLVKLTKDDLFEVVRAHAEDGVDFMTIHCGINKSVTKTFKETGRLMNIVSRGGSLLFGWMEVTGNENPFYEYFDELLEICHEYDVTISLGDSCRPGCLYDSNDATETAEMIELGKLCKRAWAAGVQVMVEGPGHMALDEIAANMKLQEAPVPQRPVLCARAAGDRYRRGIRPHHRRHRRRHLRQLRRRLPVLRDAGRALVPAQRPGRARWPHGYQDRRTRRRYRQEGAARPRHGRQDGPGTPQARLGRHVEVRARPGYGQEALRGVPRRHRGHLHYVWQDVRRPYR